uniref:Putative secreted peptide n=1 Tax=Anopheles braziliensis TaxID=58242 RepID=A0A2M3ZQT1_9DIPT
MLVVLAAALAAAAAACIAARCNRFFILRLKLFFSRIGRARHSFLMIDASGTVSGLYTFFTIFSSVVSSVVWKVTLFFFTGATGAAAPVVVAATTGGVATSIELLLLLPELSPLPLVDASVDGIAVVSLFWARVVARWWLVLAISPSSLLPLGDISFDPDSDDAAGECCRLPPRAVARATAPPPLVPPLLASADVREDGFISNPFPATGTTGSSFSFRPVVP